MRISSSFVAATIALATIACSEKTPAPPPAPAPTPAPAPAPPPAPAPAPTPAPTPAPAPAPAPTPTPAPAPDPAATPTPTRTAPPRLKLTKADQPKAAEAYAKFRALLAEGRKAVQADDPQTGMARLEEALTHVPGHPSALGELGWAAYRAGPAHFDRALDATRKAIAVSKKPKQQGALYYNLGRIAEDQGNLALAVGAYRDSLAFRPGNAAVQSRLESLAARLGGKDVSEGLAKLDDVCAELRTEWGCETATSAEGHVEHSCTCMSEVLGPEEGFGRAALIRVNGFAEIGGTVDATYLVIEVAAKWHLVTLVGNDWSPGFGYVYNTSTQRRFEVVQAAGQKLLWVEFDNAATDLDPGVYTEYHDWDRKLVLCTVTDGKPGCWQIPLGFEHEVARLGLADGEIPEGEGPAEETKTRWRFDAALDDAGALVITLAEGAEHVSDDVKNLPGRHPLTALGTIPGVIALEL